MTVLLLGNGINQNAQIAPSWDRLLSEALDDEDFKAPESLTMTLGFELLVENILSQKKDLSEYDIKVNIANSIKRNQRIYSKKFDWIEKIHKSIKEISPDIILTTNYDYFIELAFEQNFLKKLGAASTKERTYSLKRFREANGHRVYHIHGEVSGPNSIMLGFEQYTGSIQRIRDKLLKLTKDEKNVSHSHIYNVLTGKENPEENCWYYHFFTDDVYILGFGLDTSEQDIWWLLTYRAKFMRYHPGLIKNKIIFYETDAEDRSVFEDNYLTEIINSLDYKDKTVLEKKNIIHKYEKEYSKQENKKTTIERKKELLKAFHVEVVDCSIAGNDFSNRYKYAVEDMKKRQ